MVFVQRCKECNAPTIKGRIYCDKKCMATYYHKRGSIKFNCDNCNKEVERMKCQYYRCDFHFCSTTCRSDYLSKMWRLIKPDIDKPIKK